MTNRILAEASAPSFTPGELAAFLGILAFVLTLVLLIKKLFVRDPPLHAEFATKEQHEELKRELDKIDQERRVSTAKLHDKIEENTRVTASIGGKLEMLNQNFHQLNTTLHAFIQNFTKR